MIVARPSSSVNSTSTASPQGLRARFSKVEAFRVKGLCWVLKLVGPQDSDFGSSLGLDFGLTVAFLLSLVLCNSCS